MKTAIHRMCILALLSISGSWLPLAARPCFGDNWPQYRGPSGAGISREEGFPSQWSDSQNLKWKTPLPGPGSSSPIVWGDCVLVTCYSGYGIKPGEGEFSQLKRHLLCLARRDGTILWQQTIDSAAPEDRYQGYISEHGYASHTPATDGQRIYAFFGKTGVVAFQMDGKKLWQTSVGTLSGNRHWGSAASPLLYQDLVIVNAADEDRSIVALDKASGKVVWKAPGRRLELTYATPLLAPIDEDRQELLLAVPGEIWGLNPQTGKLVWYAQSPLQGNIVPSVAADRDNVYAFGGYPDTGSIAVRRKGKNDVTNTNILWSVTTGPYVATPVLHDGYLYWLDDRGAAICLDARTGRVIYEEKLQVRGHGKLCYAGPVLAGGKLYCVTRNGGTAVLTAGPKFQLIALNQFESDTSDFNPSPALSSGQIFLRSNRFLYCLEIVP